MAMNRVQFQPGLSLPAFLGQFGAEAQCEAALEKERWPQGFRYPRCGEAGHSVFRVGRRPQDLPVPGPPEANLADRRHPVPGHPPGADALVPGDLPGRPGQDRPAVPRPDAAVGRQLPHGLAARQKLMQAMAERNARPTLRG